MNLPRISVVIPSFNQAAYLESAICSVVDQGYENLELIVIDGGSNDGTLDILSMYEPEISFLISRLDRGPAQAINKGVSKATGMIVGVLHSNDLYMPGVLHHVAQTMETDNGLNWVVGDARLIDEYDEPVHIEHASTPESFCSFLMHDSGLLPSGSSFFRHSALQFVGPLDESLHFAFHYDLACRLYRSGHQPHITSHPLSAKRLRDPDQATGYTIANGIEFIDTARRYAGELSASKRAELLRNCDERERIYVLAQSEFYGPDGRDYLWDQLAGHPCWVRDPAFRHALVHGSARPVPQPAMRHAA